MVVSNRLSKLSAGLLAVAAAWNVVWSASWLLALAWVLVGLWWIVPLLLGLVELSLAIRVLLGGDRSVGATPLLGVAVSVAGLNFLALAIDALALLTALGAWIARPGAARQNTGTVQPEAVK